MTGCQGREVPAWSRPKRSSAPFESGTAPGIAAMISRSPFTSDDLDTAGNECDRQQDRRCQVVDFDAIRRCDQQHADQEQEALPVRHSAPLSAVRGQQTRMN